MSKAASTRSTRQSNNANNNSNSKLKNKLNEELFEEGDAGEMSEEEYDAEDKKTLKNSKRPYKKRQLSAEKPKTTPQNKKKSTTVEQEEDQSPQDNSEEEEEMILDKSELQKKSKVNKKQENEEQEDIVQNEEEDDQNMEMKAKEDDYLDRLPKSRKGLTQFLADIEKKIIHYKQLFFKEQNEIINGKKSLIQDNAIPICSDVTRFNFAALKDAQMKHCGKMFDVIMMDPPWQLSSSQPSRGVAIAYDSLSDEKIQNMDIPSLQQDGFIFIWAINAKYRVSMKMIENWGYQLVDEITWVKKTVNGKIAKGHGFYLQHAKESCLIGVKGNTDNGRFKKNIASDVIFSERRGQSQKPEEIYQYIQQLCPNGHYLEVFARRNNLHSNWVSIGNEL